MMSAGWQLAGAALPLQKALLSFQSPPIATQLASLADHAVARNDERQRVPSARLCNGADGVRAAHFAGDGLVRSRLAPRNPSESLPDLTLEVCPLQIKRQWSRLSALNLTDNLSGIVF